MPYRRDALTPRNPRTGSENGRGRGRWRARARWLRGNLTRFFRHFRWPRGAGAWALWLSGGLAGTAALFIFAFFVALQIYTPDVPYDGDLYALNRPAAFIFHDAQGRTIGRRGAVTGERIVLKDLPPYLPAAFLAMEDRRFYEHGGIDYRGLVRALYANAVAGHVVQGGSTITQQLVKTIFLSPKRTISRKLEEMAAARELESRLSKDQILEIYLNRIYLGSGAYGVDGAAHVYFGKSARQVTLAEAAMLASLTKAPTVFSPRRDLANAQLRAGRVLAAMVDVGAITAEQAADARAHPATIADQTRNVARNYFFDAAVEEAKRLVPGTEGDLIVITTMDETMQDAAESAVARVLGKSGARSRAGQAALVAMGTDGAVRALIGGRDYAESSFNRATQAHRQPGSAFKPFVYLTAFEGGLMPYTVRVDQPIELAGYAPENYRRRYAGAMTLHHALVHSVNTVAVQLCAEAGPAAVAATARRLGIDSPLQSYASLALGTSEVVPLELTAAYASFPTGGMRVVPYMVAEVRSIDGRVLYRRRPSMPSRVADEEKALWMNAILYDVVQSGTGTAARVPGHEVAGKTGTTSDFKDAWFVGYSADLVAGVWVGNDDSTPMRHVTGSGLPAQIWSDFMARALNGREARTIPRAEPAATFDLAAADPWALASFGIFANEVTGDAPIEPMQTANEEDIVEWSYGGDARQAAARESQETWDAAPAPAPAPPSRNRGPELPPRAVKEGNGDWVGVANYPQASVPRSQPSPPARPEAQEPYPRTAAQPPAGHPNYPPANAVVAPPNTPPPDLPSESRRAKTLRADASAARSVPSVNAPPSNSAADSFNQVRTTAPHGPPANAAVPPPGTPPPEERGRMSYPDDE